MLETLQLLAGRLELPRPTGRLSVGTAWPFVRGGGGGGAATGGEAPSGQAGAGAGGSGQHGGGAEEAPPPPQPQPPQQQAAAGPAAAAAGGGGGTVNCEVVGGEVHYVPATHPLAHVEEALRHGAE